MRKPIIGIVSKYSEGAVGRINAFIRDEVKNAILDNGGIAIGILTSETTMDFARNGEDSWPYNLTEEQKEDMINEIKLCDGIIFQGGPSSSKFETFLANYTYLNDIPTLGICAGQNALIRGVGGEITKVSNPEKHSQDSQQFVHPIFIKKGTKFYDIVKKEEMMVNSRHKNCIKDSADKYIVSAVCDDGYFDVIEAPDRTFNIGVRFHPESLYKVSKEHNDIFVAFINSCKDRIK